MNTLRESFYIYPEGESILKIYSAPDKYPLILIGFECEKE